MYLPNLNNLESLICSHNDLTTIPKLNNNMKILICSYNKITKLNNKITTLSILNNKLIYMDFKCDSLLKIPNNIFLNKTLKKINNSNIFYYVFY